VEKLPADLIPLELLSFCDDPRLSSENEVLKQLQSTLQLFVVPSILTALTTKMNRKNARKSRPYIVDAKKASKKTRPRFSPLTS
jgi:hypothetical protein